MQQQTVTQTSSETSSNIVECCHPTCEQCISTKDKWRDTSRKHGSSLLKRSARRAHEIVRGAPECISKRNIIDQRERFTNITSSSAIVFSLPSFYMHRQVSIDSSLSFCRLRLPSSAHINQRYCSSLVVIGYVV